MANNQFTFSSVIERFMSHVRVLPNGCWEWTGALDNGYGRFCIEGVQIRNPRAAWMVLRGPVPEDREPDHLCRFRPYVNPDHMEVVTHQVNCQRGNVGKHLKDRTHCPKGHPYSGTNLRIKKSGARRCNACSLEETRKRRITQGRKVGVGTGHNQRWLGLHRSGDLRGEKRTPRIPRNV